MSRQHVLYREVTPWPWWVTLLLWAACLGGAVSVLLPVLGGTGQPAGEGGERTALLPLAIAGFIVLIPVLFHLLWGALVVEVTSQEIRARFGRLGLPAKRIAFRDVVSMEAVTYRPIREFGGWGIRFRSGGRSAWTTRGNRALRIRLEDGKTVYLGSDHPERLRSRVASAVGGRFDWA